MIYLRELIFRPHLIRHLQRAKNHQMKNKESSNSKQIDFSSFKVQDFINEHKAMQTADKNRAATEGNETERSLCGQLMLITTVLLSANFIFLGNKSGELTSYSIYQTMLILLGISLLLIALFCGIKHYFNLIKYWEKWAKASHNGELVFTRQNFKTWDEAKQQLDEALKDQINIGDRTWLNYQIVTLCITSVIYIILVTALLVDFNIT